MTDPDESLVRRCIAGDRYAFETLIEKYQKPVFNVAFRMAEDYEDARDISHTVFLKAYENLGTFAPGHRFYSWLYRIAINESLNLLQKRRKTEAVDDRLESGGRTPEDQAQGDEISRLVQRALMSLATDHRAVLILRHFLDCSYAEIAGVLDVPEKTVKSRLFTARQTLKAVLQKQGVLRS